MIRKHQLLHLRAYHCTAYNCLRSFSSIDDLERHHSAIHKITLGSDVVKYYMCAMPHCMIRDKIWYYLDDFRQHCGRIHQDQYVSELVRQSAFPQGCHVEGCGQAIDWPVWLLEHHRSMHAGRPKMAAPVNSFLFHHQSLKLAESESKRKDKLSIG